MGDNRGSLVGPPFGVGGAGGPWMTLNVILCSRCDGHHKMYGLAPGEQAEIELAGHLRLEAAQANRELRGRAMLCHAPVCHSD